MSGVVVIAPPTASRLSSMKCANSETMSVVPWVVIHRLMA